MYSCSLWDVNKSSTGGAIGVTHTIIYTFSKEEQASVCSISRSFGSLKKV